MNMVMKAPFQIIELLCKRNNADDGSSMYRKLRETDFFNTSEPQ